MASIRRQSVANISKNLKDYREKRNMNQREFSSLLEMDYQNYSKLERGTYNPSLSKVLDMCRILGLTPNDLLLEGREFDDYKKEVFDNLDNSLFDLIRSMKVIEPLRARAFVAQQKGDKEREIKELDTIVQVFDMKIMTGKTVNDIDEIRNLADQLYYNYLLHYIKKYSSKAMQELSENMMLEEK